MQNAIRVFVDGETQPTRHIDGVGGRGKLVGHCRHSFVFARALNDLIDKTWSIRPEDPGKPDHEIPWRNPEHLLFACQLGFGIDAQRSRRILLYIRSVLFTVENVVRADVNHPRRFRGADFRE